MPRGYDLTTLRPARMEPIALSNRKILATQEASGTSLSNSEMGYFCLNIAITCARRV